VLQIPYVKFIPYPFEVVLDQYFDYEHIAHVHPCTLGEYVLVEKRGNVAVYDQHWPADRRGRRAVSRVVQTYQPPGDIWFEFESGKHLGTRVHSELKPHPKGTEVQETYHLPRLPNWGWLRWIIRPAVIRMVDRVWDEDLRAGVCIGGWPGIPDRPHKVEAEAWRRPLPPGTYPLGRVERFPPGSLTAVNTTAGPVLVAHTAAGFQVVHPTCTHTGGPLGLGKVENGCVVCPWHAARFDLATGQACGGPAKVSLHVYPTRVMGGELVVHQED
jgi:nitrite reductase/ring-hydroxylating ferredoxin subunit